MSLDSYLGLCILEPLYSWANSVASCDLDILPNSIRPAQAMTTCPMLFRSCESFVLGHDVVHADPI